MLRRSEAQPRQVSTRSRIESVHGHGPESRRLVGAAGAARLACGLKVRALRNGPGGYNPRVNVPGGEEPVRAVTWRDGRLWLLDQRALPERTEYLPFDRPQDVAGAIAAMVVRGAPAIGIAAAYGVALAARVRFDSRADAWREGLSEDLARLAAARPTAVNLGWALARMTCRADTVAKDGGAPFPALLEEARAIHHEDVAANRRMGALGSALIERRCTVLTHCNTGALATGGHGTALGVVRTAYTAGKIEVVLAGETRPWLQGARLTAWELVREGIPVRLIADSAAGHAMRLGGVDWVVVGADRVAANGDVANKIGTSSLAVNARHHGVGFMVVAPCSTVDMDAPGGESIALEERGATEVVEFAGSRVAPAGAGAWNPVFDVTPAELVDALVTERGVVHRPNRPRIAALMSGEAIP